LKWKNLFNPLYSTNNEKYYLWKFKQIEIIMFSIASNLKKLMGYSINGNYCEFNVDTNPHYRWNKNFNHTVRKSKHIYKMLRLTISKEKLTNIKDICWNLFNKLYAIFKTSANIFMFNTKWILIATIISGSYFLLSLYYIQIEIAKQLTLWYIFAIFYYLLMSTFNSFLIKYRYGKFTSAIQRFWKRTGIVFWLIEGFLFLLFFYYFLNSSQEPLYMFDYSSLNQELVLQLKISYKNLILTSLSIYLSYILIYNLNFFSFYQNLIILTIILLIIFYSLYIESYQFIYIINLYSDKFWLFEDTSQSWVLEAEQNNLRVKQQYFIYCLIAKYWHFIFIFISWFFFYVKSVEIKKISYSLLGYNTQNLLILYVLNLLCLIQWLKYLIKKFLEVTYHWFHIQYDEKLINNFSFEILSVISSLFNFVDVYFQINNLIITSTNFLYTDSLNFWKNF
jgi:hypothetical protein